MNSFIENPIWHVMGVIVGIAGIVLSLVRRHRKSISCLLLSKIPLSNTISDVDEKLKVVFKSKTLERPFLLAFRFINAGNVPLRPDDFMTPISIHFSQQTQIITAEVIQANPSELDIQLRISENSVEILPTLLNPIDSFILKLLLDQFDDKINISARIVGIRKVEKYPVSTLRALGDTLIFGVSVSLIAMIFLTFFFKIIPPNKMLVIAVIGIIYGLLHEMIHLDRNARQILDPSRLRKLHNKK